MPLLFILLLVIGVRSLTLPGAERRTAFPVLAGFLKGDRRRRADGHGAGVLQALHRDGLHDDLWQLFSGMISIPLTTVRVMCADLFVSMLAGIAIFPAVFAFGFEPSAGPSLLFITIPAVFASIPFGHLFMVLFFVLSAIAATGAMLSILRCRSRCSPSLS